MSGRREIFRVLVAFGKNCSQHQAAGIESIVNTLRAINNDSGMDVMQKYNNMMNDQQYQNILAASWK